MRTLMVIRSVCMLWHRSWWHRSTMAAVRGEPTLLLRRRHIWLVRWHSGHGRRGVHGSAIWWNRWRVSHRLHVRTAHVTARGSGVWCSHHMLRWRRCTTIRRIAIEHHRITHTSGLGGLSVRIFFVWRGCWLVRRDRRRVGDDREHLHILLSRKWPNGGNCAGIRDLVVLERIEVVLDMHRLLLDNPNTEVRVWRDSLYRLVRRSRRCRTRSSHRAHRLERRCLRVER